MHRGLYKTYTVDTGYIRNKHTGENLGQKLELYCYTANENNIYYDTPHIDYPDNYEHVVDNKVTSVASELKEQGFFRKPYAIVSHRHKITSIERFKIDECNSFFAVPTDDGVVDIITRIGFENIKVLDNIFELYLNKHKMLGMEDRPYLLLMFLESDNDEINELLNKYKLTIIRNNMNTQYAQLMSEGIYIIVDNQLIKLGASREDTFNLKQAIENPNMPLVNSFGTYMLTKEQLAEVSRAFIEKENRLNLYYQAYWEFVENLFLDPSFRFSTYAGDNFLAKGYTNKQIIDRMEELLCTI